MMILFVAAGGGYSAARADGSLRRVEMSENIGYIVDENYALEHKADLLSTIPRVEKIEGFWTPSEQDAAVRTGFFGN